MRTVAGIAALVPLVGATVALFALMLRARRNPPAPPRPEAVRAQSERLEHRSRAERVAGWMLLLPIIVPGVLLLTVGDGRARMVGLLFFGSSALALALSVATGRSGRYEKVRARALARSEAYWSQRPPTS